jgi:hypothetical protein
MTQARALRVLADATVEAERDWPDEQVVAAIAEVST